MKQTSLNAFLEVRPRIGPQQAKVLAAIQGNGGLTREEISRKTGLRIQSVCGRVNELERRGILQVAGFRANTSGSKAEVLVAR